MFIEFMSSFIYLSCFIQNKSKLRVNLFHFSSYVIYKRIIKKIDSNVNHEQLLYYEVSRRKANIIYHLQLQNFYIHNSNDNEKSSFSLKISKFSFMKFLRQSTSVSPHFKSCNSTIWLTASSIRLLLFLGNTTLRKRYIFQPIIRKDNNLETNSCIKYFT